MAWSHSLGQPAVVDLDVVVVVPRLALAVPDLHEAHAALDQPAGDQQSAGPATPGPYMSRIVLRLAADVERVGRLRLHAVGQLERLDAGLELRVVLPRRRWCRWLSCCEQVELLPLLRRRRAALLRMFSISFSTSVCCVSMYVPW